MGKELASYRFAHVVLAVRVFKLMFVLILMCTRMFGFYIDFACFNCIWSISRLFCDCKNYAVFEHKICKVGIHRLSMVS